MKRRQCQTHQQTVWELPDVSRVPVAKHPGFGRYFWELFKPVMGRDLMTSFDRPRAKSSSASALKLVAASMIATIQKGINSDFAFIPHRSSATSILPRNRKIGPLLLQTDCGRKDSSSPPPWERFAILDHVKSTAFRSPTSGLGHSLQGRPSGKSGDVCFASAPMA